MFGSRGAAPYLLFLIHHIKGAARATRVYSAILIIWSRTEQVIRPALTLVSMAIERRKQRTSRDMAVCALVLELLDEAQRMQKEDEGLGPSCLGEWASTSTRLKMPGRFGLFAEQTIACTLSALAGKARPGTTVRYYCTVLLPNVYDVLCIVHESFGWRIRFVRHRALQGFPTAYGL